jgi:hypothetical protein
MATLYTAPIASPQNVFPIDVPHGLYPIWGCTCACRYSDIRAMNVDATIVIGSKRLVCRLGSGAYQFTPMKREA